MTRGSGKENQGPIEGLLPPEDQLPGEPTGAGVDALPRKIGRVEMQQTVPGSSRKVRVPVILKVYATTFGRYAVVAQDRTLLCKDCGFINLRNCTVQATAASPVTRTPSKPGFQIISRHCEGEPLNFTVKDSLELEEWLAVLDPMEIASCTSSPIAIPKSSSRMENERLRRPFGKVQGSASPKQPAMPCLSEGDEEEVEEEV